jgi:5-hydroxyisourate hydrolase
MGRLTTHVLDTSAGQPAGGIRIELFRLDTDRNLLLEVTCNRDGRPDAPLLEGDDFSTGEYELVFHAGDYFGRLGLEDRQPRFLDQVVVRFGVADPSEHFHVPLLLSPFGYSTYRGS